MNNKEIPDHYRKIPFRKDKFRVDIFTDTNFVIFITDFFSMKFQYILWKYLN